jgi:hypothetical protein
MKYFIVLLNNSKHKKPDLPMDNKNLDEKNLQTKILLSYVCD